MTETTSNGYEIEHPVGPLSAEAFRTHLAEEYGLAEGSPATRVERLKDMSVEGIAILLEDINKSIQGSRDSLMNHESAMKIGDTEALKPEDRHQVFLKLIEDIRACPENTNPARIGDVLALGVVLLHPFHDGNGRTARTLGLMFRNDYDSDEYEAAFDTVTEARDKARARGGFMIYGYIPHLGENIDQSNPVNVSNYLHGLLHKEEPGAYVGCFGQAPLLSSE